jgi:hypothetical protein
MFIDKSQSSPTVAHLSATEQLGMRYWLSPYYKHFAAPRPFSDRLLAGFGEFLRIFYGTVSGLSSYTESDRAKR